ncbi:MAG: type II toxin-antitoxin system prevent-host-death family antitoxin [Burkholderiaceae bacterium]
MAPRFQIKAIDQLHHTPASDVKKLGWRGVMRSIGREGKVVVTNHNEPEAVILSAAEYDAIMKALQDAASRTEPALDMLRQRFDDRLVSLQTADAGDRLRALARSPARLGGKVRAGDSH